MSYDIDYFKSITINNPKNRDPLPIGVIWVDFQVMVNSLGKQGYTIHQFEPLQIVDKVGYLKSGDEAAEILLDSLQEHMKNTNMPLVSQQDIIDSISKGMTDRKSQDAW